MPQLKISERIPILQVYYQTKAHRVSTDSLTRDGAFHLVEITWLGQIPTHNRDTITLDYQKSIGVSSPTHVITNMGLSHEPLSEEY